VLDVVAGEVQHLEHLQRPQPLNDLDAVAREVECDQLDQRGQVLDLADVVAAEVEDAQVGELGEVLDGLKLVALAAHTRAQVQHLDLLRARAPVDVRDVVPVQPSQRHAAEERATAGRKSTRF
jgi:hypothetical protein